MTTEKLFSGTPAFFGVGGLSNEKELAKECPEEFRGPNKWSYQATKLFFSGGKIDHWQWKNPSKRDKQLACFKGLISGYGLSHEDKMAVAGWMLSEMLIEFPKYIPVPSK